VPYTLPTLTDAQTALANRLNDQFNTRWPAAELTQYLREALRTWNAWTQFYRSQESFITAPPAVYYDLPTVAPTTRGYTVTTWDLVADLQVALLEPVAPGGTWTGTDQFTLDQLVTSLQRRRDQFLRETGAVLSISTTNYAAPDPSGRLDLDESISVIRSAGWLTTATGLRQPLMRTDEWAGTNYQPLWSTSPRAPFAYSVSVVPPLTLQLMPPASGAGSLDLVTISKGSIVDPLVASLIGIPDDWTWVLKYGVLADLLQGDGLALDPARAAYCEQRWQQGILAARSASVVLTAQIDGLNVMLGAVADADQYSPYWSLLMGSPVKVLTTGQNLVATWPPAGGLNTITLDLVANMPVPLNPTDVLQVDQTVYDSILDLAQHLALFKEGPGQLDLATALLNRVARAAGVTLQFQQASQPDRASQLGQQQQDRRSQPEQLLDVVPIPVED